jgi:hypothetical protein
MSEFIERCQGCNEPTGHAGVGEDSISIETNGETIGPLCHSCVDKIFAWVKKDIGYNLAIKLAVARERERCRAWISDIMERREHSPCWYTNDDGDCGNWVTCSPDCSLRQMMDLVGIIPQDDGKLDKQSVKKIQKEHL